MVNIITWRPAPLTTRPSSSSPSRSSQSVPVFHWHQRIAISIILCMAMLASLDQIEAVAIVDALDDERSIGERCQLESESKPELFIPCVLREHKKSEIRKDLEALLPDMPLSGSPIGRRLPSDQLRHILRTEGFTDNGQELNDECPGPHCESQTSMIMLPVISDPPHLSAHPHRSYFNTTSLHQFHVESAKIHFFVRRSTPGQRAHSHHHGRHHSKYTVLVYQFLAPDLINTEPATTAQRNKAITHGIWDKIDVTDQVRAWTSEPRKNYGLMVKVDADEFETNSLSDSQEESAATGSSTNSYLEVKVSPRRRSKHQRRSIAGLPFQQQQSDGGDCAVDPKQSSNHSCCRYPLEINFDEFGWDWIVAPRRYNAYYCAGQCRRASAKPIQHSSILAAHGGYGMCCSPQSLSEMKLLYLDSQGNMHMKAVPNMIVQRCGCS